MVVTSGRVVGAKQPDDLWHLDLTAVPTRLGFWTSWVPWALPQEWPFCWWIAVALDHFSRRVQGWMVSEGKPSSQTLRALCEHLTRSTNTAFPRVSGIASSCGLGGQRRPAVPHRRLRWRGTAHRRSVWS